MRHRSFGSCDSWTECLACFQWKECMGGPLQRPASRGINGIKAIHSPVVTEGYRPLRSVPPAFLLTTIHNRGTACHFICFCWRLTEGSWLASNLIQKDIWCHADEGRRSLPLVGS